jgi:diamine N-acetyltransferase
MPDLITLREIERGDWAQINAWRNDREVVDFLGSNFLFIAEAVDEQWYDSYLSSRDRNIRLAIVTNADDAYIGNVQLTSIHPLNRSAEFSIFIGDKRYWSHGYGREAMLKMLQHGFGDLNLNRIHLTVLDDNERAIRLYESAGFKVEGRLVQAVFKNGSYHDLIAMAALRKDFVHEPEAG